MQVSVRTLRYYDEIAVLLDDDVGVNELRGILLLRRAEAHERLAEETERLARVEARLHQMEETTMSDYDVIVKRVEPEWVIAVHEELAGVSEVAAFVRSRRGPRKQALRKWGSYARRISTVTARGTRGSWSSRSVCAIGSDLLARV